MRFRVTLKDPDGFGDALEREASKAANEAEGVDAYEREGIHDRRRETLSEALEKWVEYDEYVTVEFDTDAGTATVVERGQ